MTIRWGIVGAGIIAGKMADALEQVDGCELRAVASRTPGKAEAFVARFGGEAHGDYAALMTREDIDIVYVATTHNFHCANASQALLAGKHVLVEKPFTATGEEALQIRELARRHGRFCMEAMWTRFLPSTARLIEVVRSGRIGAIRHMTLTFGGVPPEKFRARLFDPALAGGVALDMGVYPLSLANFVMGSLPVEIDAIGNLAASGVDTHIACRLRYADGCIATIGVCMDVPLRPDAHIYGENGRIHFPEFQNGNTFIVEEYDDSGIVSSSDRIDSLNHVNGFVHQVEAVRDSLGKTELESAVMPVAESVATMALMDTIRRQFGVGLPAPSETRRLSE